jgi:hypothetical protein
VAIPVWSTGRVGKSHSQLWGKRVRKEVYIAVQVFSENQGRTGHKGSGGSSKLSLGGSPGTERILFFKTKIFDLPCAGHGFGGPGRGLEISIEKFIDPPDLPAPTPLLKIMRFETRMDESKDCDRLRENSTADALLFPSCGRVLQAIHWAGLTSPSFSSSPTPWGASAPSGSGRARTPSSADSLPSTPRPKLGGPRKW